VKNGKALIAEESSNANRRDSYRPPGKKITLRVERREESDTEATVRHGVQKTVARGDQKQVHPNREKTKARQSAPKSKDGDNADQQRAENNGMGEPSVTPKVTIVDAVPESDDIQVGDQGQNRPDNPDTLGDTRLIEARPDAQSSHRV
jgi:hypothetical protein